MKQKLTLCFIVSLLLFTSCYKKETAMYQGEDISKYATVIRDKETKATTLKINVTGLWKIYYSNTPDTFDLSNPVLTGEESGTFVLDIAEANRAYFYIDTEKAKGILSERHLPMAGGYNFRDLGGYKTTDGRYVKWGKLFRSDELAFLTDADLKYLSSNPLTTIIDFRSLSEVEKAPDKLPESIKHYYNLNIEVGNVLQHNKDIDWEKADFNEIMRQMNRMLVTDKETVNQYHKFFRLLQDGNNAPSIYHCSAGKDRTGMATALILSALGVDFDTILQDYTASTYYLADKYASYLDKFPNMEPLLVVKPEFIQAGFDEIKTVYGSVENYLTKTLDVDIEKMKEIYLY